MLPIKYRPRCAIAVGPRDTVVFLEDGSIAQFGRCNQFRVVPQEKEVVKAAIGWDHMVFLLEDGTAVPWGMVGYWEHRPQKKIVDIASGRYHIVLVFEDGTFWQSNLQDCDLEGKKVVKATAGKEHTVLLTEDNTCIAFDGGAKVIQHKVVQAAATGIWTWVLYESGCIGVFTLRKSGVQVFDPGHSRKVVQVAPTLDFTVWVMDDGTADTCTYDPMSREFCEGPGIPHLKGKRVVEAGAGDRHAVLVLEDGTAVSWDSDWDPEEELTGGLARTKTYFRYVGPRTLIRMPGLEEKKIRIDKDRLSKQCLFLGDHLKRVLEVIPNTISLGIQLKENWKRNRSLSLGIQLKWVLEVFPKDVQKAMDHQKPGSTALNCNFEQIAPFKAYGPNSYGAGKICPRDGQIDCSIVDAVLEQGHSRRATIFLSWVWKYKLSVVLNALCDFCHSHGGHFNAEECFVWWCFFVNNQHRILGQNQDLTTDELAIIFSSRLQSVGKMVCLMDKIEKSEYTTRIWCVFEVFIALRDKIDMEVILPATFKTELHKLLKAGGLNLLRELTIDVEKANAKKRADEANIKRMILDESSYEAVNRAVQESLARKILSIMKQALVVPLG